MIDEILDVVVFFLGGISVNFHLKGLTRLVFSAGGRWLFCSFPADLVVSCTDVFFGMRIDMLGLNHPKKKEIRFQNFAGQVSHLIFGETMVSTKSPGKPDLFLAPLKEPPFIPFKSP